MPTTSSKLSKVIQPKQSAPEERAEIERRIIFAPVDKTMGFQPPKRHYEGDAGYDLTVSRSVSVFPKGFAQVPSNIKIALPRGCWAYLMGRSSTFFKRNLLVNPACIDNGWRGELWAMVYNPTDKPINIIRGERLIQIILFPLTCPGIVQADGVDVIFPDGERGEKGFGSTGGIGETKQSEPT